VTGQFLLAIPYTLTSDFLSIDLTMCQEAVIETWSMYAGKLLVPHYKLCCCLATIAVTAVAGLWNLVETNLWILHSNY